MCSWARSRTTVALTGTGVEPRLDVAPAALNFPKPGVQVITLTSSGSMSVQVLSWTVTGLDAASFVVLSPVTCTTIPQLQPGSVLEQGTVCSLSVAFKPRHTGVLSATLEIRDNSATPLHSVPLSGTY